MPHPPGLSLLLHRALEPRLGRLLELCGAPGWQEDPEALHQVRIASRRVRAVLDLADPEVYPGFRKHERRLRRLTRALSLTRELDVHAIHLEALKEGRPDYPEAAAEHVLELLEGRRRKARKAMSRNLARLTLKDLDRLLTPPSLENPVLIAELSRAVWDCLAPWIRAVEAPLSPLLDQEHITGMHVLRIQVKRLRYTLEILEPAFPEPLADWLQRLKVLQTILGQHHDQALLEAFLGEVQGELEAHRRPLLASGVLVLLEAVAEERRTGFERFRASGRDLLEAMPFFRLRQALGAAE